jgi:hypothetical protein
MNGRIPGDCQPSRCFGISTETNQCFFTVCLVHDVYSTRNQAGLFALKESSPQQMARVLTDLTSTG